mgnify:CR=1 FL=1
MEPEIVTPVVPEVIPPAPTPLPASDTAGLDTTAPDDTSNVNWGELANESEVPEEEIASPESVDVEAPVPAKVMPGAAVAPPVVPPAPVQASTQTAAPIPSPAPQSTSTPAPVAPAAPAPAVAPADFAKQREEWLAGLEQSYAMTEDEGVELLRAPEKVLPKLAARVQLNIMDQLVQTVAHMLPQFVDGHLNQQKASEENRTAFFKEWPDLNKPEYQDTLTRIAVTYRQQNPDATKEKAVKEIGAIAAITLGVVPAGLAQPTTPSSPQPPAFRPVMPGGGGRPATAPVTNEFTQLANEWGDE